jgi:hypothetical protein
MAAKHKKKNNVAAKKHQKKTNKKIEYPYWDLNPHPPDSRAGEMKINRK